MGTKAELQKVLIRTNAKKKPYYVFRTDALSQELVFGF